MNWYKIAKIGEGHLKNKGVPDSNIDLFAEYLHSLPDNVQNYLMKNYISKNPTMTVEELKAIPVTIEKDIKIDPKMEQYVRNITNNKKERQWLRKLVQIGKVKEEDVFKIANLFAKFKDLPDSDKRITDFENDSDLSKYIDEKSPDKIIDPNNLPEGAKLLESFQSDDGENIQLYNLTTQEGLDAVGAGASWCVLSENGQYSYDPFDYYCFVVNGKPEILIHTKSGQIKDAHDATVTDAHLIKSINPSVEKYNLNNHYGDFEAYSNTLNRIKEFEDRVDDEDFINSQIEINVENFSLLPKENRPKYTKKLIESIGTMNDGYDKNEGYHEHYNKYINPFDDLSYSVLEQIGKHITLNNDEEMKKEMNKYLKEWMDSLAVSENLSVGRYKKKVPPTLSNKELFNETYRGMVENRREHYLQSPYNYQRSNLREIREDPEIKEAFIEYHRDLIRQGNTHGIDSFPEEAKNDPKAWYDLLMEKPKQWDRCHLQEVKMKPEIFEKAKEYYVNEVDKANSTYNARLKHIPKEFKEYVLSPEIWRKKILEHPISAWKDFPIEEIKNDPEIISHVKKAWKNKILDEAKDDLSNKHSGDWSLGSWERCPFEDVKNDPEVIKIIREVATRKFKKFPRYYKDIPFKDITENQELWDEILSEDGYRISDKDIPEKYKSLKAWKSAIIREPYYYLRCPVKEVTSDPEVVSAYLKYIGKNLSQQYPNNQAEFPSVEMLEGNSELKKQFYSFAKGRVLSRPSSYKKYIDLVPILEDPEIKATSKA